MPEWTSWIHLPKFTDEEFEAQRANYIAKNGYTITVPGLEDVFRYKIEHPMTTVESHWWKTKQYHNFSPQRLQEIREMKQKRHDRFEAALSSPSPAIARHAGSIMCALDDLQDGLSTIGTIGQIATRVLPQTVARYLEGPVGIILTTADVLNTIQSVPQMCLLPKDAKRKTNHMTRRSVKHYLGKVKKAVKLRRAIRPKAAIIEGLQTTQQVFGVGLCLGPLVGLAQDILAARARRYLGQDVKLKLPIPDIPGYVGSAQKISKAAGLLFGFEHFTDDEDILGTVIASEMAHQVLMDQQHRWDPLEQVEDIASVEVKAPSPWHVLTQEVMLETGFQPDERVGWPQTGELWSNIQTLAELSAEVASENLGAFLERNRHFWRGYIGSTAAVESAMFCLALLEGQKQVEYDYSISSKIATKMLEAGLYLNPNQADEKFTMWHDWVTEAQESGIEPSLKDIVNACHSWREILLIEQRRAT